MGHAHLILKPEGAVSESELAHWCRERMANYKVPKRFFIRSALPMLSIGKVDKIALRQQP
ncbi:Long-chain-fatty-acid--CoA ligase FadD13 [compost metagenome]